MTNTLPTVTLHPARPSTSALPPVPSTSALPPLHLGPAEVYFGGAFGLIHSGRRCGSARLGAGGRDHDPPAVGRLDVFCLGWNVTVRPPWYAHGHQETDVGFEAFPPPVHHRAEGRAAAAPSRGQGAGLEGL